MTSADAEKTSNEGLPDLNQGGTPSKPNAKKLPVFFISGALFLLISVGYGVQILITEAQLFKTDSIAVEEPPLPVLAREDLSEAWEVKLNTAEDQAASIQLEALNEPEPIEETSQTFDAAAINDTLHLLLKQVSQISSRMDRQTAALDQLKNGQLAIDEKIMPQLALLIKKDKTIAANIKTNERWLAGLSHQLKAIGVKVQQAAKAFPIIVYDKNIWGDEVFLTVAQKDSPKQTRFLRIGAVVGPWKLVSISENTALFEHSDGISKEVKL